MQEWARRHPRVYTIGATLVIIASGLATFQGIWNLFSNEPFFPYILARLPHWVQIVLPIIFGSIFIACIVFMVKVYHLSVVYKTNKGLAIAKYADSILERIEKRDLQLKDATVTQYKTLFSFNDLSTFFKFLASTDSKYVESEKDIERELEGNQLKQDKIERHQQIDNLFEKLRPLYEKEWTLELSTAYGNKLDIFPKMQNSRYKGIMTRREKDKRWRKLLASLSNVKVEYPDIFADKELDGMINEYIDRSFGNSSLCLFVELVNWYIPVDIQPTPYIDSGTYAPYTKMHNRIVKLREDISNKIVELASESDKKQKTVSKNRDANGAPNVQ